LILDYVAQGKYVMLLFEENVTHLTEFLLDLPKDVAKKCLYVCDTSDIFEVDRILDGYMSIAGNVPPSLFCVGSPNEIEKYCEKLFEHFKERAQYMLGPSLGIPDEAKPENVHAIIDYAHKYGQYS
jgi:uroporphyrinogen-III decarboxylase